MRRYHPLTILFELKSFIQGFGFIAIFAFVLNGRSESTLWMVARYLIVIGFALTLIGSIMKWFSERYAAEEEGFRLRSGIFDRSERTVYYEKIQNVHEHTSFFHKLFKMTSLTFETGASALSPQVKFTAVTQGEAARLKAAVKEAVGNKKSVHEDSYEVKEEDKTKAQDRIIHFTPTRKDTVKASFTSFSFLVITAVAVSVLFRIADVFGWEDAVEGWGKTLLTNGFIAAASVILLLIVAVAGGMVWTFIKYGKYEIASDDTHIFIRKGTLSETAFSIAKQRVQAVEITQSFTKRILGIAEVKLISAGELGEDEDEVSMLYPFLPVKQAYALIEELLPGYAVIGNMRKLPKKALYVRLLRPYYFWIIAAAVLFYFKPAILSLTYGYVYAAALLLLLIAAERTVNYFNTAYAIEGPFIQFRSGTFAKTVFLTRRDKIIEVGVKRSKLQQWTGLSTIGTVNRAKPVHHESVRDVPAETGGWLLRWYTGREVELQKEFSEEAPDY